MAKISPVVTSFLLKYEERRLRSRSPWISKGKSQLQIRARQKFLHALESHELQQVEVPCPVCESDEYQSICQVDRDGLPVHTVRCLKCPTLYSRAQMTTASLERFYTMHYRELYGEMIEPDDAWFQQQVTNGDRILKLLTESQLLTEVLTGIRVLEIGTGAGGALLPFLKRGDQVLGLDLNENFLAYGRSFGLNLVVGGVDSLPKLDRFDLVILKDVLEHLPNPTQVLKDIREKLVEGGMCYLQVPGLQGLGPLGYRNDLLRYFQIAHMCHYTIESLSYLCERAGLRVRYINEQGIVVCSRVEQNTRTEHLELPSSEIAVRALRKIYLSRIPTALRLAISSPLPEFVKSALRRLRSVLIKWRH